MIKRILTLALFLALCFALFGASAWADDMHVSTLEELRNATGTDGKIVLEADISLDSDTSDTDKSDNYLSIFHDTVLDLNGHRLYRELSSVVTNGYIIYVPADGSLTILDSAGGGGLTGGNSSYAAIRPSAIYVRGTLVLNSGSIRDNRNAARGGGAIVVEGGSFTMNGGEICDNEGIDGGVVVADGHFTMNGGSIHNNNGTSNAGGVYMTNNATNGFIMNGGYIQDNTCRDRGAGVYVQNGAFTLNGGQIIGNRINSITSSAMGSGGGVYVEYGSFTMTGGSISGNGAYPGSTSARGGSGGGVYLSSNSSGAMISGGRVTGNTTGVGNGSSMEAGNGAGIYVGSRLTVSGAPVIVGNTQDGRPNDLYLSSGTLAIGEGGLQAGASIGIMHHDHNSKFRQPSPTTFTEGLGGNIGVFFANTFYYNNLDRTYEYAIQGDGDEAQLAFVGDSDLTVTFMRGDGTDAVHTTQRVISGGSVSRPAEPVWNGHVFEGWHTDPEAVTPYAFGGELTDNLTLYAHWVESATVTFHANGGRGSMEPQVFGKGMEQNLNPCLFFRDYYIFDGWTANADGTGTKYADRAAITVTGDTSLYANWTPNNFNIIIAGVSNGTVTAKVGGVDNATTAHYTDTVTLSVTPAAGYALDTLTVMQEDDTPVTTTQGTGDNKDKYTFTMPAGDVQVSATFRQLQKIFIQWSGESHSNIELISGFVDDDGNYYTDVGDTVTFRVVPEYGYGVSSVSATEDYGEQVVTVTDLGEGKYSFVMPDYNVDLYAECKGVRVDIPTGHGTVTMVPEHPKVRNTVTLNVSPEEGYALDTLAVTKDDTDPAETVEITPSGTEGEYTFTMPEVNVTVIATFKLAFGTPDFTLPANLQTIEANAFEGAKMTIVDAHTCTEIGAEAFKSCTALRQIKLPKDCTIAADAFAGCGTVYVFAPAGGTTESWCRNRTGIVFVAEQTNSVAEQTNSQGNPDSHFDGQPALAA